MVSFYINIFINFLKHNHKAYTYLFDLETKQILSIVDGNRSCISILINYKHQTQFSFSLTLSYTYYLSWYNIYDYEALFPCGVKEMHKHNG